MMTLGRWDDCGEEMNQEEADQDVVDEVSEEVDSRLLFISWPDIGRFLDFLLVDSA